MIEKLKHKYALSEKGANGMVRAFIAVTVSNLVLMLPVGLLYKLASYLLEERCQGEAFLLHNRNSGSPCPDCGSNGVPVQIHLPFNLY